MTSQSLLSEKQPQEEVAKFFDDTIVITHHWRRRADLKLAENRTETFDLINW